MKSLLYTILGLNLIGIGYRISGSGEIADFILGVFMQLAGILSLKLSFNSGESNEKLDE